MAIRFERTTSFTERRRQGRAPLGIEIFTRERSRSAASARLSDLSSFGCCVENVVLVQRDAQVWIRLPGLESLAVRLV